jgi:hypothetical protein
MNKQIRTVSVEDLLHNYPGQEDETFCAAGVGGCFFNSFLVTAENGEDLEWKLHFDQGPFDQYYSDIRLKVSPDRWQKFIADDLWCQVFGYTSTYEKVIWENKIFDFNPTQARLVAQMHNQFLLGNTQQFEKNIFSKSMINLSDYRLDKAFRSLGSTHALFGKLIVRSESHRGAYKFQPSPAHPTNLPTSWLLTKENAQKYAHTVVC